MVAVLPVVPVRKYCAVYNLAQDSYHGMEEVMFSTRAGRHEVGPLVRVSRAVFGSEAAPAYRGEDLITGYQAAKLSSRLMKSRHKPETHSKEKFGTHIGHIPHSRRYLSVLLSTTT